MFPGNIVLEICHHRHQTTQRILQRLNVLCYIFLSVRGVVTCHLENLEKVEKPCNTHVSLNETLVCVKNRKNFPYSMALLVAHSKTNLFGFCSASLQITTAYTSYYTFLNGSVCWATMSNLLTISNKWSEIIESFNSSFITQIFLNLKTYFLLLLASNSHVEWCDDDGFSLAIFHGKDKTLKHTYNIMWASWAMWWYDYNKQ